MIEFEDQDIPLPEPWTGELVWCPSQLYREYKDFVFYCRWRWDDPWTISLMDKNRELLTNEEWINETFNLYFHSFEWQQMIAKIEEIKDQIIEKFEKT